MEYMEIWKNEMQRIIGMGEVIVTVTISPQNSTLFAIYCVENNEIRRNNEVLSESDKIIPLVKQAQDYFAKGIHLYKFVDKECIDEKYVSHYNPNLLGDRANILTIYQEYGYEPQDEWDKNNLQESIKKEKIKDTLVYACYLNDNEKIQKCLSKTKISKTQLNMRLDLCGTPLTICAENNNVEAFKAIAEKGAEVKKSCMGTTPLASAWGYSPEIVEYIYENFREVFDKEMSTWSMNSLKNEKDVKLLKMAMDGGCDIYGEGDRFPPLHSFVIANNLVGIKFLLDNGVDVNILDKNKETALDIVKKENLTEVVDFLQSYIEK